MSFSVFDSFSADKLLLMSVLLSIMCFPSIVLSVLLSIMCFPSIVLPFWFSCACDPVWISFLLINYITLFLLISQVLYTHIKNLQHGNLIKLIFQNKFSPLFLLFTLPDIMMYIIYIQQIITWRLNYGRHIQN